MYTEDLFLELFKYHASSSIQCEFNDVLPINNFFGIVVNDQPLTKNQASFVIKLLFKYRSQLNSLNIDTSIIDNPVWKHPFRVIDYSKKISIEKDSQGIIWLHCKFPFSFKDTFTTEFLSNSNQIGIWDIELKIRKIKLFDINLVKFIDLSKKHNFEIDQQLLDIVESMEEVWQEQDTYIPYSVVLDNVVELKNASSAASTYFNNKKTNDVIQDMFLAKSMGYPVEIKNPQTSIEKLCSNENNLFWSKNINEVTQLIATLGSYPVVVVLDRTSNVADWTKEFVLACEKQNLDKSSIRVCFRFNKDSKDLEFNSWIKNQGIGGEVATGKIFICQHKPPKWMAKDNFKSKLMITNNLYPSTNLTTSSFIESHPAAVYVGNIKPSEKRNKKIVEL